MDPYLVSADADLSPTSPAETPRDFTIWKSFFVCWCTFLTCLKGIRRPPRLVSFSPIVVTSKERVPLSL